MSTSLLTGDALSTAPALNALKFSWVLIGATPSEFLSANADGGATFYLPPQHRLAGTGGLLTEPTAGDPLKIAMDYLGAHAADLGLSAADLNYIVTDRYTDEPSGITHLYFRQTYQGLEVMNADVNVSVTARGEVISVGSSFVNGLEPPASIIGPTRVIEPTQAYRSLNKPLGLGLRVMSRH